MTNRCPHPLHCAFLPTAQTGTSTFSPHSHLILNVSSITPTLHTRTKSTEQSSTHSNEDKSHVLHSPPACSLR